MENEDESRLRMGLEMTISSGHKCSKCRRELTAEERLLAAMFGADEPLCQSCNDTNYLPKCHDCGKPTSMSFNGMPLCAKHIGDWGHGR